MFYVYLLVRPNKKVFYVGKGKNDRIFQHEIEARRGHKCHKCNVIRKIWRNGGQIQRYTVLTTENEQEAFDYEIELITQYGRKNLTNLTDGGDGATGRVVPDHIKAHMKEIMPSLLKAKWQDPTFRANVTAARRTPEYRRRQGDHIKEQMAADPDFLTKSLAARNTPDVRAKLSRSASANGKKLWSDPKMRAHLTAERKARGQTPEERARMGTIAKKAWQDPEIRARNMARIKARSADPERRARHGALMRAKWADPECRARMLAKGKRKTLPEQTSFFTNLEDD